MMGNDYKRRFRFVQQVREKQRRAREGMMMTQAPSTAYPQVQSRNEANRPMNNKRQQPQTAVHQPQPKRRIVDLTDDNRPSVSPPSHRRRPLPVPIPTHLIPRPADRDAHAHAVRHGVHLPDLDLNLYGAHEAVRASLQHQQDISDAKAALDPVPHDLQRLVTSATTMTTHIVVSESRVGAAAETTGPSDLDSASSEHEVNRIPSPSPEPLPVQIQCTVDEDESLRAPEQSMLSMTDERARVEYELSFFQCKRVYV